MLGMLQYVFSAAAKVKPCHAYIKSKQLDFFLCLCGFS